VPWHGQVLFGQWTVPVPPDELGTLFTRAVARAAGFSDGQIRRRVTSGYWNVVVGPVLAPAGVEITSWLTDRAAMMAVPDGVLSGPSAARRHGIEQPDRRTWITVLPGRRIRLGGVKVRREKLADLDIAHTEDMALTTVCRTVFDCVRELPLDQAERLLRRALNERWITHEAFLQRVHAHTGRHGVAHLVTLVSRLAHARRADPVEVLAGRLTAAGISGWSIRQPFRGQAVDLVFHQPKLAVDCGGGAWHNGLVRAGWTVLRYSPAEVLEHTDAVVCELLALRDKLLGERRRP
jgi:hypothetical protein